jgi:hypothetical protein
VSEEGRRWARCRSLSNDGPLRRFRGVGACARPRVHKLGHGGSSRTSRISKEGPIRLITLSLLGLESPGVVAIFRSGIRVSRSAAFIFQVFVICLAEYKLRHAARHSFCIRTSGRFCGRKSEGKKQKQKQKKIRTP